MELHILKWARTALLVVVALCITAAPVSADEYEPTHDPGSIFVFINLSDDFWDIDFDYYYGEYEVPPPMGSTVLPLYVGDLTPTDDVLTTIIDFFEGVSFPTNGATSVPGHPVALAGALDTLSEDTIHLISNNGDEIDFDIQEAYFNASQFFGLLPESPTTQEIAQFIVDFGGVEGLDVDEVAAAIFVTEVASEEAICESPCEAEGEMFPHGPGLPSLGTWRIVFDLETGEATVVLVPEPHEIVLGLIAALGAVWITRRAAPASPAQTLDSGH